MSPRDTQQSSEGHAQTFAVDGLVKKKSVSGIKKHRMRNIARIVHSYFIEWFVFTTVRSLETNRQAPDYTFGVLPCCSAKASGRGYKNLLSIKITYLNPDSNHTHVTTVNKFTKTVQKMTR